MNLVWVYSSIGGNTFNPYNSIFSGLSFIFVTLHRWCDEDLVKIIPHEKSSILISEGVILSLFRNGCIAGFGTNAAGSSTH